MTEPYTRVYDVGLLDDLHNYFPALLYQQELFTNVSDVLSYIRERTIRRFNLFDLASRQYQSQQNIRRNTRYNEPRVDLSSVASTPIVTPLHIPRQRNEYSSLFPLLRTIAPLTSASLSQDTVPLIPYPRRRNLNAFTGLNGLAGLGALYDDVIVHASNDIVNQASTVRTLDQDLDIICTVCQDRMRQGEEIRKLTSCNHEFHTTCVDNWLLNRSVFCPTCRHDIREQGPTETHVSTISSTETGPTRRY